MDCVVVFCTMSELELGNWCWGWLSNGWVIIWKFITCLITELGGIEGWAQLWLTRIPMWPLHVVWPLYRQLLIVSGLCRVSFDLESEVRGITLLHSIGYKRVSKDSPDLRGRGIVKSHCRKSCGMQDSVVGIFGKIQSATLCCFWLISLIDWLLFSLDNE